MSKMPNDTRKMRSYKAKERRTSCGTVMRQRSKRVSSELFDWNWTVQRIFQKYPGYDVRKVRVDLFSLPCPLACCRAHKQRTNRRIDFHAGPIPPLAHRRPLEYNGKEKPSV